MPGLGIESDIRRELKRRLFIESTRLLEGAQVTLARLAAVLPPLQRSRLFLCLMDTSEPSAKPDAVLKHSFFESCDSRSGWLPALLLLSQPARSFLLESRARLDEFISLRRAAAGQRYLSDLLAGGHAIFADWRAGLLPHQNMPASQTLEQLLSQPAFAIGVTPPASRLVGIELNPGPAGTG